MNQLFTFPGRLLTLLLLLWPANSLLAQTLDAGSYYTLSIHPDGTLWAWGLNDVGELGDGTYTNQSTPVQIGTDTNWRSVSASGGTGVGNGKGEHVLAVRTDGTLWGWGANIAGQVGDGTTITRSSPVRIGTATNWQSVSAGGYFSLALRTDGTLWTWGRNIYGQVGDGTTNIHTSPIQVGTVTTWQSISAGDDHSLAVRSDGTLWAWGRNQYGQIGDGTTTNQTSPVRIGTATNWASVSAGGSHSLALRTDGSLWTWGSNGTGQLGDGSYVNHGTPQRMGLMTWQSITASNDNSGTGIGYSLAIRADGTLWGWGLTDDGELGLGSTYPFFRPSPVQSGTGTNWQQISAGNYHSVGAQLCRSVWGWGSNQYGQVGDGGSTPGPKSPVLVYGGSPGVLSYSPAVAAPGSTVTVTGTGLSGLTALLVNGVNALPSVTNSTATSFQFVVPTTAGTAGTFSLTSGCGSTTRSGFSVLAARANVPVHHFVLSPNPAHGSVAIEDAESNALVEVFDLRGRLVAQVKTSAAGAAQLILPATLTAGMYLLRCGAQITRLSLD